MQTVSVREVQHHLADYIRKVERGEQIRVTRRSRPVAMIVPAGESDTAVFVDWTGHEQSILKIFGGRNVIGKKMEEIVKEGRERL